jgi:arylsulfatase A-like enzyme
MMRTMMLLVVAAFMIGPVSVRSEPRASTRPNVLFILADDHAAGAIGAYGSRVARTPHIDRLAAEGMLFRNAFVTNPICGPSRAVILTGRFSHLNGVLNHDHWTSEGIAFNPSQSTFPRILHQTAIVGKWQFRPEPRGFDHWSIFSNVSGQGSYYNPEFKTASGSVAPRGYATDIVTDQSLEWLARRRDPSRPFLLIASHKAPHRPFEPDLDRSGLFGSEPFLEPDTLFDDYSTRTGGRGMAAMSLARHFKPAEQEEDLKLSLASRTDLDPEQQRRLETAYAAENEVFRNTQPAGRALVRWRYQRYAKDYARCVSSLDDAVGRLLHYLDDSGLAENTIVVYASDQGLFLGEHGLFDKRWPYEESLRIPLIVRWAARIRPGSQDSRLVQNLDLAPTLLAAAGLKPPREMQGKSILPRLLGDPGAEAPSTIYFDYHDHAAYEAVPNYYGVRTDRYKLIYFYEQGKWELYDLSLDPHEMRNVHRDPAYAAVSTRLAREMKDLRRSYRIPEQIGPLAQAERRQ